MSFPRHQCLAAPRHHPMTLRLHLSSWTRAGSNHFSITPTVHHIHNQSTGSKETMDTLLSGQQGLQWTQALENEWDRLATGKLDKVKGSNTISFIPPSQIPGAPKVTYGNFVCDHRPLKAEPLRVRLTVGGDRLDYPYDTASPASNLVDAKLLINSVILDANIGAQFMVADLKDFFLNTPMERAEYMKIKYKYFPSSIRTAYDLQHVVTNDGWVYIKIIKGMYGLNKQQK